jgi:hypothetical protein
MWPIVGHKIVFNRYKFNVLCSPNEKEIHFEWATRRSNKRFNIAAFGEFLFGFGEKEDKRRRNENFASKRGHSKRMKSLGITTWHKDLLNAIKEINIARARPFSHSQLLAQKKKLSHSIKRKETLW